ncbi:hypothetical protein CYLTODRAFT_362874 [Cylindrobasidium torrendii FP15055 ss-10]|uniref:Uncharacterized protein n=1 Tax=Cylindrobasidium torrendii FP15055 ss-10 TaxID=1314674 RepID=A0A0D7AT99_9AGAR|nr:hypothetical protein CYLTODRAFT_362874 [Cylindrobasidium torrendii FP15055 ss-10]
MFPKNDIKTRLKSPPPGPCRACGSDQHWNIECPDWQNFLARSRRRDAKFSSIDPPYDQAYEICLSESLLDFEEASQSAQEGASSVRCKTYPKVSPPEPPPEAQRAEPRGEVPVFEEYAAYDAEFQEEGNQSWGQSEEIPGPPPKTTPIVLSPKRKRAPGDSAMGVSVLSMRGTVGEMDGMEVDQRLDTCANVSLMSYEFWKKMPNPPKLHKGRKLGLYQLTSKDKSIEGYCTLPVFTETEEGEVLHTTAEVYLVTGMTVPLLLGEDYQLDYELSVSHNLEEGTRIRFGKSEHVVRAREVMPSGDAGLLNARRRKREQAERGLHVVRATKDVILKAHTCVNVEVEGHFRTTETLVVEKGMLELKNGEYLAVPNVLIDAARPVIPIANTSSIPRRIRKGEAVAWVNSANEEIDRPQSQVMLAEMQAYATALKDLRSHRADKGIGNPHEWNGR